MNQEQLITTIIEYVMQTKEKPLEIFQEGSNFYVEKEYGKEYINKDSFVQDCHIYFEAAIEKFTKDYSYLNIDILDAYYTIKFQTDEGEVIIPNTYGNENSFTDSNESDTYFDFILVYKNKIITVDVDGNHLNPIIKNYNYNNEKLFNEVSGKRAFYNEKDYILLRVSKEFYKTLPEENRFPQGEDWCSGPHFKLNKK
jgi:frataxin-like iron-binding protein CyaY